MLNRNLYILFFCQLVSVSASMVMVTLGGIIGTGLTANASLATLPVSLMVVGTALSTIPAAMLMKTIGRRLGFSVGSLLGALGTLLAAQALRSQSFVLFCAGLMMLGINLAFVQQFRFAAAESVAPERVGRAISLVLLGSIGGALLGPEFISFGRDWIEGTAYVGTCYGLSVALFGAALLLLLLKNQPVVSADEAARPARPLRVVVAQPVYLVAMLGGVVAYGVMSFIMTATPVSMHLHDGHTMAETGSVIRSHVIAMYAPSLASGFLIERLGTRRMMALGAFAMLGSAFMGLQGQDVPHYWAALVLLGIGWNFLYIGGTTLLTTSYRNAERFKAQAVNDFGVFAISAAGSLLAGTVIHLSGWTSLMLTVIAPLLLMLLALFLSRPQPLGAVEQSD